MPFTDRVELNRTRSSAGQLRVGRSRLASIIGLSLAIVLIAAGGVVHGWLSNRWGVPVDQQARGMKLREIPLQLGPWIAAEDQEMPESTITLLECQGYINRVYVHQLTGESVAVAVLFGPKGPIAVHTPEVCYSSRDFTQTGGRRIEELPNLDANLWRLGFQANNLEKSKMIVYYGWSDGEGWQAAERPRFWQTDYLYKIQTSSQPTSPEDPTPEFLELFLPALQAKLQT